MLAARYNWSSLNKQQVGAFAEYFVKMELTMYGFQVYGTEVDDRGIDFVTRYNQGPFISVQVKALRKFGYIFMRKRHFKLVQNHYLALGFLKQNSPPELFLIPAVMWQLPNAIFVSRDYEGLKSEPEWGINLSQKNFFMLNEFRFEKAVEAVISRS